MSKKKADKKTPAKKTAARKQASGKAAAGKKKTVRKTATSSRKKPAAAKKTSATASGTSRQKSSAKKAAAPKKKQTAASKKAPTSPKSAPATGSASGNGKTGGTGKTTGNRSTSRVPATKARPVAFSLEEAQTIAKTRSQSTSGKGETPKQAQPGAASAPRKSARAEDPKPPARVLGAASLADILGRSPDAAANPIERKKEEVPKKFSRYYKSLMDLREHVLSELDLHTKDTLKRSTKEDSGNLSGYGQHMADAGTDSFDRDFALSLVSTEQEALSEIEAAIDRIHKGTYGICEITGKPIARERLLAVPFARYSVEGQAEYEKNQRRPNQRGGAYLDSAGDSNEFMAEDPDE